MIREAANSNFFTLNAEGGTFTKNYICNVTDFLAGGGYDEDGNLVTFPKIGSVYPGLTNPQLYCASIGWNPDPDGIGTYQGESENIPEQTDYTGYYPATIPNNFTNPDQIGILSFEYSTTAKLSALLADYAISWELRLEVDEETKDFTDAPYLDRETDTLKDWIEEYAEANNLEETDDDGNKITPPSLLFKKPVYRYVISTYSSVYRENQILAALGKINSNSFWDYIATKRTNAINENARRLGGPSTVQPASMNDLNLWYFSDYESEMISPSLIKYTFYFDKKSEAESWNEDYNVDHNLYLEADFSTIFAGMDFVPTSE